MDPTTAVIIGTLVTALAGLAGALGVIVRSFMERDKELLSRYEDRIKVLEGREGTMLTNLATTMESVAKMLESLVSSVKEIRLLFEWDRNHPGGGAKTP